MFLFIEQNKSQLKRLQVCFLMMIITIVLIIIIVIIIKQ